MTANVDVVIPAHDAVETIVRTLDAVCAQVEVDLAVVVVDDGSTDGTYELVSGYDDDRVSVVRQTNGGPAGARNTGARNGSAPWIAFLDADQVPEPDWLATLLEHGRNKQVVGGGGRFVADDGSIRPHLPASDQTTLKVIYQPGHFLIRRDLFDDAGGYDEQLRFSENTELGLRVERLVGDRSTDIAVTDRVLVTTFDPPGGTSRQFTRRRRWESAERIIEVHADSMTDHQLASYHAIAGVQARHFGERSASRSHLVAAVRRRPTHLRYWAGLVRSIGRDGPVHHTRELVLHVMPADLARGGQAETRTICDRLDGPATAHRAVTIFRSPPGNLRPEYHLDVPDGRLRAWGFDPRAMIRARAFVRRMRPAIVVAHGGESLKYLRGVPRSTTVVYHKIGVVSDAGRRGLRLRLHRWLLRRPDLVVAVSNDAAQDAHEFGRPDAIVVPNCRVVDDFPAMATRDGGEFRALFVGHLTASKQPEVFVDVIGRLRNKGVAITGTIVGDGPLRTQIEAAAPPGVTVLGRRSDIATLFSEHDVLVFTSRREGEGMPGVLIEAGLCARPAAAFDVPGVRDIVIDGETGVVVAAGDVDDLVDAVASIVQDRDGLHQMGQSAREHCRSTFNVSVVADAWRHALECVQKPLEDSLPDTPASSSTSSQRLTE